MLLHHSGTLPLRSAPPTLSDVDISRLVFYFPMVGLINLFLYILKYPASPSATGDVSMLDVAVGHFGLLEVTTNSELSYPFAREVARIAYQTVKSRTAGGVGSTRSQTPATALTISEMTDNNVSFQDEVRIVPKMPLWPCEILMLKITDQWC